MTNDLIMQKTFFTAIILLSSLLSLVSCSDDDNTSPQTPLTDIHFSINVKSAFKRDGKYELIVLSSDNKLLRKERVTRGTMSNIHVASPTETVNVVIIDTMRFSSGDVRYEMMAFMHVSPDTWELFPAEPVVNRPSTIGASMTYLNMPDLPDENLYFVNTVGRWNAQLMPEYDAATFYYNKTANDYTYMLIPGIAKYKFSKIETSDVVDASSLESVVKVKLTGQPASMNHACRLVGYPENGNFTKELAIYPDYFRYPDIDYMYPENHFAHYELFYGGVENGGHHEYYAFSTTCPTSVSLFNEAHHQVTQENLQVNLSYQVKIPTLTYLVLNYNNIRMVVTLPSELNAFKYDEFVRELKSELLPKTAPYRFELSQYDLISVTPFEYVDYQNFLYSPEPKQKQVTEKIHFFKGL